MVEAYIPKWTMDHQASYFVVKHKEKDLYWGIVYDDHRFTQYGWGPIQNAQRMNSPISPENLSYDGSPDHEELRLRGITVMCMLRSTYTIASLTGTS